MSLLSNPTLTSDTVSSRQARAFASATVACELNKLTTLKQLLSSTTLLNTPAYTSLSSTWYSSPKSTSYDPANDIATITSLITTCIEHRSDACLNYLVRFPGRSDHSDVIATSIEKGFTEALAYFLSQDADAIRRERPCGFGKSPYVYLAANCEHDKALPALRTLYAAGADPNIYPGLLQVHIKAHHTDLIRMTLGQGLQVPPCKYVCEVIERMKLLREMHVSGEMVEARKKEVRVDLKVLIELGADVNWVCGGKYTPFELAMGFGDEIVVEMLRDAGAIEYRKTVLSKWASEEINTALRMSYDGEHDVWPHD